MRPLSIATEADFLKTSMRTLYSVGVGFIGLVLLYAVVDKLFHWSAFLTALTYYPFLPYEYRTTIAYPVLILESGLAAGLILPSTRRAALIGCCGLFGLFAVVTYTLHSVNPESACGCFFSFGSTKADLLHVAQNITLTALSLFLWRSSPKRSPMPKESQ